MGVRAILGLGLVATFLIMVLYDVLQKKHAKAFRQASLVKISAMSFGSLSGRHR